MLLVARLEKSLRVKLPRVGKVVFTVVDGPGLYFDKGLFSRQSSLLQDFSEMYVVTYTPRNKVSPNLRSTRRYNAHQTRRYERIHPQ